MKIFLLLITALTFVAGCSPSLKNPSIGEPPARIKNDSALGFNADELSDAIAPTDDFYAYVNGRWLEKTDIPAEWSSYGAMQILYEKTEQQVWGLIQEAGNQTNRTPGSDLQKIRDLYLSFMDESLVNELGIRPLDPELEHIEDLQSHQDLVRFFGHALAIGVQVPVNFYIDANAADTNHTLVYFWQDGLGLPDRDYYLSDTEKLAVIREQYLAHIERMFALAGWKNGAAAAEQIFAVENRIANIYEGTQSDELF